MEQAEFQPLVLSLLKDLKDDMNRRFEDVDRRFEDIDRRFKDIDRRFEAIDSRFAETRLELGDIKQLIKDLRVFG